MRDFLNTSNISEKQIDRCEFWVSAHRKVMESGTYNHLGEKILVNNRINFDYLESKLSNYGDKEVIEFLKYGWP